MTEPMYTEYDNPNRAAIEKLKELSLEELERLIKAKESEIRNKRK